MSTYKVGAQCSSNIAQVQKNAKLLFLVIIAEMERTAIDFQKLMEIIKSKFCQCF